MLDRETIPSYTAYKSDTDGMGSIGSVFPVIFFLVAALVSLTTMTRMVEEQRTQIGTLKALGYTKGAIAAKYVLYALLATAIGSVLGVLLGESTIPLLTVNTYKLVYIGLHNTVVKPDVFDALLASLLAIICTTGATLAACYRVLSSSPALLMRPEAPKAGKRILLEKSDLFGSTSTSHRKRLAETCSDIKTPVYDNSRRCGLYGSAACRLRTQRFHKINDGQPV